MTPTVITEGERVRRVVEDGSRRKRDLSVYRRVKAREAAERMNVDRRRVAAVWLDVAARLAASVPAPTYVLWLGPLFPVGADGTRLYLTAPEGIRAWTERRYSGLIREALKAAGAPYRQVTFVGEGEPCL